MSHLGPSLRRARRANRTWPRVAVAVLVSLVLNVLLVRYAGVGVVLRPPTVERSVELSPLSASQWNANRAVASSPGARPNPATPVPVPPPPAVDPRGQVVDLGKPKDSTPPKDARFLAEHDSSVDKETISRNRKPGYASTQPVPTQPKPGEKTPEQGPAKPTPPPGGGRPAQGVAQGTTRPQETPARRPAPPKDERLALKLGQFGGVAVPREDRPPVAPSPAPEHPRGDPSAPDAGGNGSAGGKPGGLDRSKLQPSASTYERLAGGPAPDHVTGVDEGEGTYLNAREWKYASYFNRIKQAVSNTWDPNRALGLRDPDGKRFAYRDRYTVLTVKLDDAGSLKDVEVVKSSGVDFLDEVAMDAFKRAQPFVNPPRGLADGHGEITFNFGFYLEVNGGFRMFRARQ